jgi:hypothetical protein
MLIPAFFYGLYPDVNKRCREAIKQIKKGVSIAESVKADYVLDTASTPGRIYLEKPMKGFEETANFHTLPLPYNLTMQYVESKISSDLEDKLFDEFLSTSWGTLLLMSRANAQDWTYHKARYRPYVDAVLVNWDEFLAVGSRYDTSGNENRPLWNCSNGLIFGLANLGVSTEAILEFVETGDIPKVPA